jgi:hypothetical protein
MICAKCNGWMKITSIQIVGKSTFTEYECIECHITYGEQKK